MSRTIKIFKLELNKPKNMRNLFIIMFAFLIFSCITENIKEVPSNFLGSIPYIILLSSFYVLGIEFQAKTDKIIFSCSYTKNEIMFSKLICIVVKSFIIGIFYIIINYAINLYLGTNLNSIFSINQILNFFINLTIYSVMITSCIFLITLLTGNGKITGVIIYILFFDLIHTLLSQALNSSSISKSTAFLIENSPFYTANLGLVTNNYSFVQITFILISSASCILLSHIILNKRCI